MDKWIFVYEYPGTPPDYPGGDTWITNDYYPVYYRFAKSPFKFDNDRGYPIVVKGVQPGSSPYVVWSPTGGPNGTIIVSDNDHSDVFTNSYGGMPDQWKVHKVPEASSYSRALHVSQNNSDHLMVLSAGRYSGNPKQGLAISVVSVMDLLKQPAGDAKPLY